MHALAESPAVPVPHPAPLDCPLPPPARALPAPATGGCGTGPPGGQPNMRVQVPVSFRWTLGKP